jgi:uncharacterized membrane protein YphA (DoxX/SURF4 family)
LRKNDKFVFVLRFAQNLLAKKPLAFLFSSLFFYHFLLATPERRTLLRETLHSFFMQLYRPFGKESVFLLLRMWLGLAMIYHGSDKLFRSFTPFTEHLTTFGIPLSQFVSGFFTFAQFVGGALVFIGFLTRPALVLVILTVFSAVVEAFFFVNYDPFSRKGELAFTYAALSFALLVSGPGLYSVDYYLSRSKDSDDSHEG